MKIELDDQNSIEFRETPWDKRVFDLDTLEITNLSIRSVSKGQELVNQLLEDQTPELCYGRFEADDLLSKQVLINRGFIPTESQVSLFIPSLERYELPEMHQKRILPLNEATEEDRIQVIEHTAGMFRFSRFHEDPFIDPNKADQRMQNWVQQMAEENVPLLVYKMKGALTSFVFYEIKEQTVFLKLGGSVEGRGMITPYFFGSVINHFKKMEMKVLDGVDVSVANTGIFKVYLALNFDLKNTFVDYHWHKSRVS